MRTRATVVLRGRKPFFVTCPPGTEFNTNSNKLMLSDAHGAIWTPATEEIQALRVEFLGDRRTKK